MYTVINFRTKKDLISALKAGKPIAVWQPGPFGPAAPSEGQVFLEGPHYPEPHRWYAQAFLKNGLVIKVK